jgi:hypothetical protein
MDKYKIVFKKEKYVSRNYSWLAINVTSQLVCQVALIK